MKDLAQNVKIDHSLTAVVKAASANGAAIDSREGKAMRAPAARGNWRRPIVWCPKRLDFVDIVVLGKLGFSGERNCYN